MKNQQMLRAMVIPNLAALFIISVVLLVASLLHIASSASDNEAYQLITLEQQRVAAQSLHRIDAAAGGDMNAFPLLIGAREEYEMLISELRNGNSATGLPPSPMAVRDLLGAVEDAWLALREQIDTLLNSQTDIEQVAVLIDSTMQQLQQIQEGILRVVLRLEKVSAPKTQVYLAIHQLHGTERLMRRLSQLFNSKQRSAAVFEAIGQDIASLAQVIDGMVAGNSVLGVVSVDDDEARAELDKIAELINQSQQHSVTIITQMALLAPMIDALADSGQLAGQLNSALDGLFEAYRQIPGRMSIAGVRVDSRLAAIIGVTTVLLMILIMTRLVTDRNESHADDSAAGQQFQKESAALLDELTNLTDGDLTVRVSESSAITGMFASPINYAIQQLSDIVSAIQTTTSVMRGNTRITRQAELVLEQQMKKQIEMTLAASGDITNIENELQTVVADATQAVTHATSSVALISDASQVAGNTIDSINQVRGQIQETARRLKRLGESSQQISEMTDLMEDIAEQTSILAMNAAMRAANAGDAGRAFAAIVDEIQRLAESSARATQQIEVLVGTIQTDTRDAVESMEGSTTGVFTGAKLVESSEAILEQINLTFQKSVDVTQQVLERSNHCAHSIVALRAQVDAISSSAESAAIEVRITKSSLQEFDRLTTRLQQETAGFQLPDIDNNG